MEDEKLIYSIANSLYRDTHLYSVEDLFQIGCLSYIKLQKHFDKTKSKKSTFMTICIRRDIVRFIKKHRNNFSESHTDSFLVTYHNDLFECLPELGPEDAEIIRMLSEGYSKREIAKRFHLKQKDLQTRLESIGNRINA